MRKIVMQKIGKIAAVSVMSAIISISFNGCGFLKSTGNKALASLGNTAQQGISSLGNTAEKGISNALSSESKSSSSKAKVANNENDKGKCSGNEIKTDTSIEKGECKGGKRNGVWKYYDNYGYIQKEITFQNGAMTLEKVYDKNENLEYATSYDSKGKVVYKREYESGELKYFMHFNTYFERKYEVSNWKYRYESKINEAKQQAQEIAKQRAESKVKKPTMQEVAKSKNAMDTYRAKLQAQVEKELQIELSKIQSPQVAQKQTIAIPQYKEPKLDTYEEFLELTKDKEYTITESIHSSELFVGTVSKQDSNGSNFESNIEYGYGQYGYKYKCNITNNAYGGDCLDLKSKNFFKGAIEKSMFKDKFNAVLP